MDKMQRMQSVCRAYAERVRRGGERYGKLKERGREGKTKINVCAVYM